MDQQGFRDLGTDALHRIQRNRRILLVTLIVVAGLFLAWRVVDFGALEVHFGSGYDDRRFDKLDCDQRTRRASRLMLTDAGCVTLVLTGVGLVLFLLPVPTYVTAGAFTQPPASLRSYCAAAAELVAPHFTRDDQDRSTITRHRLGDTATPNSNTPQSRSPEARKPRVNRPGFALRVRKQLSGAAQARAEHTRDQSKPASSGEVPTDDGDWNPARAR